MYLWQQTAHRPFPPVQTQNACMGHSIFRGEAIFSPHFIFKLDPPEGKNCKVRLAGLCQWLFVAPNRENDKKWRCTYCSTGILKGKICKDKQLDLRQGGFTRGKWVIFILTCTENIDDTLGKHFPVLKKKEPGTWWTTQMARSNAGIPCMPTTCKVCVSTLWQAVDSPFAQRPTEKVALTCDSSLMALGSSPLATTSQSAETECKSSFDGQYLQHWFTDSHRGEINRGLWSTQGTCVTKHRTLELSTSEGAPDPGPRAYGELQKVRMYIHSRVSHGVPQGSMHAQSEQK